MDAKMPRWQVRGVEGRTSNDKPQSHLFPYPLQKRNRPTRTGIPVCQVRTRRRSSECDIQQVGTPI
jgi:hypothetical protein